MIGTKAVVVHDLPDNRTRTAIIDRRRRSDHTEREATTMNLRAFVKGALTFVPGMQAILPKAIAGSIRHHSISTVCG